MKPKHVAIIPDGNRRWAKNRGMPAQIGHTEGGNVTLPKLIREAADLEIEYFTFWALSTENLKKRSETEISHLFKLIRTFMKKRLAELHKEGARVRFMGNIKGLPQDMQDMIYEGMEKTQNNTRINTTFAVNYGGHDELVRTLHRMARAQVDFNNVVKEDVSQYLDSADIPNPDLIIRTGGEKRLSGFMLWQCEYSEMMFLDEFFPDLTPELFRSCIAEYDSRQRRFGK